MINTLLFDLDGTLTLSGDDEFMKGYLGVLSQRFSHLIAPDQFLRQMLKSTEVMKQNTDAQTTNLDVFLNDFCAVTGLSRFLAEPIFNDFYQYDFPTLDELTKPHPLSRAVVEHALSRGLKVAIASNAVLPENAMRERLRWANVADLPFLYLPSVEKMHACKPQVQFFEELLSRLDCKAEECLMIGDDGFEDMAASQLGIKTFLIDRKSDDFTYRPDYIGNLDYLMQLIDKM